MRIHVLVQVSTNNTNQNCQGTIVQESTLLNMGFFYNTKGELSAFLYKKKDFVLYFYRTPAKMSLNLYVTNGA